MQIKYDLEISLLRNSFLRYNHTCAHRWQHDLVTAEGRVSRLVVSDSLQPHELQPTRLLCPWDFPGKNTGVGYHFLLQAKVLKTIQSPLIEIV